MTHPRKTIRDAVVAKLVAAAIVPVGRVYSNRALPLHIDKLPMINVVATNEESQVDELSTGSLRRSLTLAVEIIVKDADDEAIDDVMDAVVEQVEAAMKADDSFGIEGVDSYLSGTEFDLDDEGDAPTGHAVLTYEIRYFG